MLASRTVADHFVARIAADGIGAVFGVTGGGVMFFVDAIARSESVRLISTQHEEYAGVAADGFARAGGKYGVAIGTTGPGAAQLFAAVAAAYQDSSPVVFIVGQVKSADSSAVQGMRIRQNGTFEFDTRASFSPICKYHAVVDEASGALTHLDAAIDAAVGGRPGPVVLEVPLDVQGALVPAGITPITSGVSWPTEETSQLYDEASVTLRVALTGAARPLVLLGIGAVRSGDHAALTTALDESSVPYVVTQFAREAGSLSHELYLGSPGIKANRSANIAVTRADLLIIIGSSLHQQVVGWESALFADLPARKIWFEIDPEVRAVRGHLVDEVHAVDAETAMWALTDAVQATAPLPALREWQDWCRDVRGRFLRHYPEHVAVPGQMCLYRAVSVLDEARDRFAATTTDAGLVWYVLAQHYFPGAGASYVSSGSFGAMGMALPYAVGAAVARRAPVLAVTGDGSLMMCLSELATLRANSLPVLVVVNNNDGYASIRSTHDRYFEGRKIGTDASNGVVLPEYRQVAATFGLPYRAAHDEGSLREALDELMGQELDGPAMIEVFTYADQTVEPLVGSRRLADGTFVSGSLADMYPTVTV